MEGKQVDEVARTTPGPDSGPRSENGFSLIEVMVAIAILSAGLMSLVGVFALGVQRMTLSTPMLLAREKAREAVESVHAARDNGELAWNTVLNTNAGGVFLTGEQDLRVPGNDGLVNTVDDGAIETMRKPGYDQQLGTADDEIVPLTGFKREIRITTLNYDAGVGVGVNPTLRQVQVIVKYKVENAWRTYTLTTYVSAYA
jgi:prepilin-type N-terminal cleavage/methylation domain-containing protein